MTAGRKYTAVSLRDRVIILTTVVEASRGRRVHPRFVDMAQVVCVSPIQFRLICFCEITSILRQAATSEPSWNGRLCWVSALANICAAKCFRIAVCSAVEPPRDVVSSDVMRGKRDDDRLGFVDRRKLNDTAKPWNAN